MLKKRSPDAVDRRRLGIVHPKALAAWLACVIASAALVVESGPAAAVSGTFETMYSGLYRPVALAFAQDGRIFFAELYSGKIRIIENDTVLLEPFYTFDSLDTYHDRGLLGLALDPSFPAAPWVYAYYTFNDTANGTSYNRIVRVQAIGNSGVSMAVLLDRIPVGEWHVGGVIQFGVDGKLYALVGDAYDPATAQDLHTLSGKVLRMNPNGSVPDDNPFVGNASANPYIYTFGLRNMFGIAFHPATSKAIITENGPECNDEVNLLIPGRNYGWGPNWTCYHPPPDPLNTNQDGPDPVLPLTWYTPPNAPTNAIVYNGPSFTAWQGDLFFGTWNDRNIHRVHLGAPNYDTVLSDEVIVTLPADIQSGVLDVEVGLDGAIWFTSFFGIYRFYDTSLPPVASFTTSASSALVGDAVAFNGSASYDPDGSIVSYAWDFGDGSSGSGVIVTHPFETYGMFDVTLVVTDIDNLAAAQYASIRVLALPTASFVYSPSKPLQGDSVTFDASNSSDPDGNITEYRWEWGDGSNVVVSSSPVAEHAFAAFGQYAVNLTVTDSDGMTQASSVSVPIFAAPSAAFTFSPPAPRIGEAVTFDGSASVAPNESIVSYAWDFGDNSTGSGTRVDHGFSAAGSYVVVLTVVDTNGFAGTASESVIVRSWNPPVASFTASSTLVVPDADVTFDASSSSDPEGPILGYSWDFGDGATDDGVTTVHAYANSGSYTVTLTVLGGGDLTDSATLGIVVDAPPTAAFTVRPASPSAGEAVVFDGSTSTDSEGSPMTFTWSFGDDEEETGQVVSHVYAAAGTYVVTLLVADSFGLTDAKSMTLAVEKQNEPPAAVLAISPTRVNPHESVTFDASGSRDADGSIVSYEWDFGDGATDREVLVSHAYAAPGVYVITLTVTDNRGGSDATHVSVRVNAPPIAAFSVSANMAYPGVSVQFDASASSDLDSEIASYAWDFGDGATADGALVGHTYGGDRGTFTVRLVVMDDLGAQNATTKVIEVGNRPPQIVSTSPQAALVVNLSRSMMFRVSAFDPDGDPLTYAWSVGGVPVGISTRQFEFVGLEVGNFVVKVVVSDGSSAVDFEWVVEVRALPTEFPLLIASIILAVAIGAVATAWIFLRRRSSRERGPR